MLCFSKSHSKSQVMMERNIFFCFFWQSWLTKQLVFSGGRKEQRWQCYCFRNILSLFFIQSYTNLRCDGSFYSKSLLVLLWDKFTLVRWGEGICLILNARLLLQKITIGDSLFVLVVFLFITHGAVSVCAMILDTHLHDQPILSKLGSA